MWPILNFWAPNDIYETTKASRQILYTALGWQTTPMGGGWSGSRDPFSTRNRISRKAEATVAKFCMQVEYITRLAFDYA